MTCFYCWNQLEGEGGEVAGSGRITVSTQKCVNQCPTLKQKLIKYAVKPFPGKDWKMDIFACSSHSESWKNSCGSASMPVDNFFAIQFCGPTLFWLSELIVLEVHSLRESPKNWSTKYAIETVHFSGKSWELGVPSQLYGTVPGVGFVERMYHSLSY